MDIQKTSMIVTGAASGMGAATARTLSQQGAKVALWDINPEVGAVAKAIGGLGVICDVCSTTSVQAALEQVTEQQGVPRVVVNCAGIIVAGRVVSKRGPMDLDQFRKALEVNVLGTFNVLRLTGEALMHSEPVAEDGERGVIINTSSVAAFEGQIGQAAYSASKGAVASMTLPIAREFAKFGIRVMAIAPGLIQTPMLMGLPETAQEQLKNSTIFPKRLGKPEEFSHLVKHLIENILCNGDVYRLDGAVRLSS